MKKMPAIGTKVRYSGNWETMQGVTGVVVKQYPGYKHTDDEGTVIVHSSVAVKVDSFPEGWPYPGYDTFAPSIAEVEPI